MKILIIEDEVKTIDYLKRGLTEQGYSVDAATDGLDGLHLASTGDYDAIILDIMLPGLDGISLLKSLRPSNNTPVIMLTAKDAVASRLEGFQAGADDYLVKPFSFLELLARLQVITKRVRTKEQTNIYIGDLHIDLLARRATRGSRRLDLTAKEFSLLEVLAQRQSQIVSKTVITELVWDIVLIPIPMLSKQPSKGCAPNSNRKASLNCCIPSAAWDTYWNNADEKTF